MTAHRRELVPCTSNMNKRVITIDLLSDDDDITHRASQVVTDRREAEVHILNDSVEQAEEVETWVDDRLSDNNDDKSENNDDNDELGQLLPTINSSRYNFSQYESYKESIDLTQDSTESIDHILQSKNKTTGMNSPIDITTPIGKTSHSVLSCSKHYSPQSPDVAPIISHDSEMEKALQSVLSSDKRNSFESTQATAIIEHSSDMEKALQSVLLSGRESGRSLNQSPPALDPSYDHSTCPQDDYGGETGGIMSYDGGMYTDFGDTYDSYNDDYTYMNHEDSNWTNVSVNTYSSMISNVSTSQMTDVADRVNSYSDSLFQVSSQKELKGTKRAEKQSLRADKMLEAFEERRARGKFAEKEVSIIMDRTFRTGDHTFRAKGNKESLKLAPFIEDLLLQGDFSVLISPSNILNNHLSSLRGFRQSNPTANDSDECCGLFMWTWRKSQLNTADRTGKDVIASYGNLGENDTEVLPFVFIYIPTQLYLYFVYGEAKSVDKMNYKSPTFEAWIAAIKRTLSQVYPVNYRIVLSTIDVHNASTSNGQNAQDTFTVYLLLEYNIDVYHCKDKKEFGDMLKAFHRSMLMQKYYVPPTELDFVAKPKATLSDEKMEQLSQSQQSGGIQVDIRSLELQETWINVLTSIPGLSRPMAKSLVSHYSCPTKLYRALTDERLSVKERQLLLQDKLRDGDKGKYQLQPKMSRLLYKIFTSTDPEVSNCPAHYIILFLSANSLI